VSSTVLVYVEDAADLVLVADAFEIGNSKKLKITYLMAKKTRHFIVKVTSFQIIRFHRT